ncbi:MFS transporter [Saccharopolyspora shandongensis]|uniref:MFS transporter n=1 Tax=Saccharopolyspora shandongensis TaxID=418495 RepID=UPI0033D8C41F
MGAVQQIAQDIHEPDCRRRWQMHRRRSPMDGRARQEFFERMTNSLDPGAGAKIGRPDATGAAGRRLVLVLTCAAQFMCVLDDTIVNVALPSIQHDLGFSNASLAWVVNGYLVTFGGLLLLAGRASDLFVRRTVFMTGLVVFGAASMTCGLSNTPAMLVASRVAQGVGAALMSAAALAILAVTFTGAERDRAFGVWGALSGVAGVAGMLLGGTLTSWLSWRWVFLINVPIVLAVAVLSPRFVPAGRAARGPALDPLGAITVTAGLGLLIFAIVQTERVGWDSVVTLTCMAGAAALLALFVVVEARHRAPMLRLAVFRLRNVSGGVVCGILLASAMLALFFFLTLYMQRVLGYSAFETGLAYLPMSLAVILVAGGLASRLISRFGFKPLLVLGFALIAGALVWFAQIDVGSSYVSDLLWPALIAGAGLGTTLVSVVTTVMHALSGEGESGLASGLVSTTQQMGGALGIAVLSAIAFSRADAANGGAPAEPSDLTEGFQVAFYAAAALALAGIVVALVVTTSGRARQR